jgi:predicted secreted protein
MALFVLLTSVGLTVQSHTCRSSGRSTAAIIFSAPEHKCPPASQARLVKAAHALGGKAQLKSACCEFGAHFHKLDATSQHLDQTKYLTPPTLLALLTEPVEPAFSSARRLSVARPWHAADSSPPRRAGRQLLTFVCTWRV